MKRKGEEEDLEERINFWLYLPVEIHKEIFCYLNSRNVAAFGLTSNQHFCDVGKYIVISVVEKNEKIVFFERYD
jgi:hypothetical protein